MPQMTSLMSLEQDQPLASWTTSAAEQQMVLSMRFS